MEHELERDVCRTISKYTPFSENDIFLAWLSYKSFDLVFKAIEHAGKFGISSVNQSIHILASEYLETLKQ